MTLHATCASSTMALTVGSSSSTTMSSTALNSNNSSTTTITSHETQCKETAQNAGSRHQRRLVLDLCVMLLAFIPVFICEFGIEPYWSGFFCSDESLHYPYQPNTISNFTLIVITIPLPLLCMFSAEYLRERRSDHWSMQSLKLPWSWVRNWHLPKFCFEASRQCAYYCYGLLLTFDATEIAKYTIGRLRPHFIAVCQPRMLDGSTCQDAHNQQRYIQRYVCTGAVGSTSLFAADDLRQIRLSFPSGHSSMVWFAMLYLAIYLQCRLSTRVSSRLMCHFLQFMCLALAWFTALSRVMDNWHHWSDVLAGTILGILGALVTTKFIAKLGKRSARETTPPPYTLGELPVLVDLPVQQYCTKV